MNIYVGNLDYKVDENDLRDVFEEYGSVSDVKVITDKYSGRSKGFGFVIMDDDSEAKNAMNELNGSALANREMVVNEARQRKQD